MSKISKSLGGGGREGGGTEVFMTSKMQQFGEVGVRREG